MIRTDRLTLRDRLAQQWRCLLLDCPPVHDRYGQRKFHRTDFPHPARQCQTAIAAMDAVLTKTQVEGRQP